MDSMFKGTHLFHRLEKVDSEESIHQCIVWWSTALCHNLTFCNDSGQSLYDLHGQNAFKSYANHKNELR